MSDLTKDEIFKALAAAEFAAAFFLLLDVFVTIDFGAIGIDDPACARGELQRFLKAAGSWLGERRLPVAWIACIERARAGNLHAHIAMHVPSMRRDGETLIGIRYRTQFRRWARGAIARRAGEHIPKAINVRCGLEASVITHWICVSYLLKGYDRSAVLRGARNSLNGQDLLLGDILPFAYRCAGDVGLDRRLFISGNLGPMRRAIGAPPSAQFMLPRKPGVPALQICLDEVARPQSGKSKIVHRPFHAAVEDGVFDIRRIYGPEFASFVTGVERPNPHSRRRVHVISRAELLQHLEGLEI